MEKKITIELDEKVANELEKADYELASIKDTLEWAVERELDIKRPDAFKTWEEQKNDAFRTFNTIKNFITESLVKPRAAEEWGIVNFDRVSWNLNYASGEFTITYLG